MKKPYLFLLPLFLFSCGSKKLEPELFLLPIQYKGKAVVIFNEPGGVAREYDQKKRLYKLNHQGIFISQFDFKTGTITQEYCYVDEHGRRMPLEKRTEQTKDTLKTEPGIWWWGHTATTQYPGEEVISYYEFYVGTWNEVKLFMDSSAYISSFDSVVHMSVRGCREKLAK